MKTVWGHSLKRKLTMDPDTGIELNAMVEFLPWRERKRIQARRFEKTNQMVLGTRVTI
jgi:hypothetical protein